MSDEEQSTQDQEVDPAKKDSAEVTVSTAGTIEGEKPAAVAEDKDAQVTDEESPKAEDSKEQKPEKESPPAPEKELPPLPPLPEQVDLNEYHQKKYADLFEMVQSYSLRLHSGRTKHHLIYELLAFFARKEVPVEAEGILERAPEGHGFLRWIDLSFRPNADDIYISKAHISENKLKAGQLLRVHIAPSRHRDKFLAVSEILSIEGVETAQWKAPKDFDTLTAMFPSERIFLENTETNSVGARVVDLVAPLGKGQRGLIVAPPRGGKTILLKDIAQSIEKNHPEVELLVVLLDERPEEVTDFEEMVKEGSAVLASTFDESPKRHVQVADLVVERAKRLVEQGKDVVILLDSITRLARGYNNMQGGKGGIMSGGLHSKALEKPRKFFGAARNVEEGGSLTILATALIETESRMDDIIFEEFKGTGNMEIHLDRDLAEQRIYPAIHTLQSGTRKDELLYHPDEYKQIGVLRRQLATMPIAEAMIKLTDAIRNSKSNAEFLLKGLT